MTITEKAARSLAVCYCAWNGNEVDDYKGIAVWGSLLREAQEETGVVLVSYEMIARHVKFAREMLEK